MIGHIKPKICKLPSGAKDEYMNLYCSVCYSLRHEFGILGTLFVNSELAIILIALRDHFLPEENWYRCPARIHYTKKPISIHKAVDCAAKFSFLLGWLKVLDWETDKPSFYKKGIRKILDKKAGNLLATLNRESRHIIEQYYDLIASNCRDFSNVRRMSYLLSRAICIELGKQTEIDNSDLVSLSEFFGLVGESLAIADPLIDLGKDIEHKEYNPIWESAIRSDSSVFREYETYRSEYRRMESQIRSKLDSSELRNVLNNDFTTTLQLGLDELSSRIARRRGELFGSDFQLHSKDSASIHSLFRKSFHVGPSAILAFSGLYSAPHGYRVRDSLRGLRVGSPGQDAIETTLYRDQPESEGSGIYAASRDLKKSKKSKKQGWRQKIRSACCSEEACEGCACCCGEGCCECCDCE